MSSTIADLFRDADHIENTLGAAAAAELYRRWIALDGDDPHLAAAHFNMAVVAQRAGDPFTAINALRDALRIDPGFHPSYINLGRALEDLGQTGAGQLLRPRSS